MKGATVATLGDVSFRTVEARGARIAGKALGGFTSHVGHVLYLTVPTV